MNQPSAKSVDEILNALINFKVHDDFGAPMTSKGELTFDEAKSELYQLIKDRVIGENEYVINPVGELKVRQERGDMFHRNQFRNSQRKALQELFEVKDDKNGDLLK